MAAIPQATTATARERVHAGNRFFVAVAIAMLVVIALGFGNSFYLRPAFTDAPLPPYIAVHGVVMTAWYLLFLAQALLVSSGRTGLHRKLGVAGVLLAAGVVVTGAMMHLRFIPRMQALGNITSPAHLAFGVDFVLQGLASLAPFAVLVAWAVAARRRPQVHSRLVFWAMAWAIGPAFTPTRPLGQFLDPLVAPVLPYFPADLFWLAALLLYDWRTLRRIHVATWLGFAALAGWYLVVMPWVAGLPLAQGWLQAVLAGGG